MRPLSAPAVLAAATAALLTNGCALDALGGKSFELTDCTVPANRIFSGGVSRDGIPALSFPKLVRGAEADFMGAGDRVLGVEVNGVARAYPLLILWWHEVVNDTVGGKRVLVTYCPLTGSGLAFDPVVRGRARRFGVSGLLFENNLIMFDRETESLWNQLFLGAQCGPDKGAELERLPIVETTWAEWRRLYPETSVLTTDTGHDRRYGFYPYGNYADPNNRLTLTPSSPWNPIRPPKELVLGIHEGENAVAYPFGRLAEVGQAVAINDTVGSRPTLVIYRRDDKTARAFDRQVGERTLTFAVADTSAFTFTDTETGSTWDGAGRALAGALAGVRLQSLADAYTLFWFSWSVYYPETRLFAADTTAQ